MSKQEQLLQKVTRIEVIHPVHGRLLVNYNVDSTSLQDDGKTLKVFLNDSDTNEPKYDLNQFKSIRRYK